MSAVVELVHRRQQLGTHETGGHRGVIRARDGTTTNGIHRLLMSIPGSLLGNVLGGLTVHAVDAGLESQFLDRSFTEHMLRRVAIVNKLLHTMT